MNIRVETIAMLFVLVFYPIVDVFADTTCTPRLDPSDWEIVRNGSIPTVDANGNLVVGGYGYDKHSAIISKCGFEPPVTLTWKGCLSSTIISYHGAGIGARNPNLDNQEYLDTTKPILSFGTRWENPNRLLSYTYDISAVPPGYDGYLFPASVFPEYIDGVNGYYSFCGEFKTLWQGNKVSVSFTDRRTGTPEVHLFEREIPEVGGPYRIYFQAVDRPIIIESISVQQAFLSFPLQDRTAYTANIESVLDHSGPSYDRDNIITAYTGEEARCEYGACNYITSLCYEEGTKELEKVCNNPNRRGIWGYRKGDHSKVSIPPHEDYLWYDGHSGYDYPSGFRSPISAPANGILCVATLRTSKNEEGDVWRNVEKCPYGNDPINGPSDDDPWGEWHTFYIIHPFGDYTTWYLHSNDLAETVKNDIIQNGYAEVNKRDTVAYVGHKGLPSLPKRDHLHFEVRKKDSETVDPYGWGNDPVLWENQ